MALVPRRAVALAGLLAVLWQRSASAFVLVTPEEAAQEKSRPLSRSMGASPGGQASGPTIRVLEPASAQSLRPPFTIRLVFEPVAGSRVRPETFTARYGFLGIDITDRLKQYARIDERGLQASNVQIPAGSHRITLSVADDLGRRSSQTFQFTIS